MIGLKLDIFSRLYSNSNLKANVRTVSKEEITNSDLIAKKKILVQTTKTYGRKCRVPSYKSNHHCSCIHSCPMNSYTCTPDTGKQASPCTHPHLEHERKWCINLTSVFNMLVYNTIEAKAQLWSLMLYWSNNPQTNPRIPFKEAESTIIQVLSLHICFLLIVLSFFIVEKFYIKILLINLGSNMLIRLD